VSDAGEAGTISRGMSSTLKERLMVGLAACRPLTKHLILSAKHKADMPDLSSAEAVNVSL
jgi:hypothetical protein